MGDIEICNLVEVLCLSHYRIAKSGYFAFPYRACYAASSTISTGPVISEDLMSCAFRLLNRLSLISRYSTERLKTTLASISQRKVNDHMKTPRDEIKTGKKLKATSTYELIGNLGRMWGKEPPEPQSALRSVSHTNGALRNFLLRDKQRKPSERLISVHQRSSTTIVTRTEASSWSAQPMHLMRNIHSRSAENSGDFDCILLSLLLSLVDFRRTTTGGQ